MRLRSAAAVPVGLTVALLAALLIVAAPAEPASASTSPAIIDNGTIQMGVYPEGHLNVPGGTASSGTGTTYVGLRYMPTNAEATAPGCLCEGWGVGDAISNISGSANAANGIFNVSPVSFTATANSARSVVDVGSTFRVTHDYSPSTDDRLYAVTVSIENISASAVDVRYRRVMDWDVEPTAFSEHVTARTGDTSLLLYNNNDGFASADPLGSRTSGSVSPLVTGEFTDVGPTDHGALFDFGFGMLQAGETKTFRTFYGAAATETDALDALASVGARLYSLGQPSTTDGPTLGTPNTFVFGFGDLGLVDGPLTEEQNRGPGNEFHRHNPQCSVGKPVNCATGNFWHTFFDLGVPGRGPDLGVARTYNASRADVDGPFGFGWSSPISMRLATAADGTVTVHQGSGSIVRFSPDGAGGFTSLRRVMATLTQDANGYELIGHRRQIFRFDTAGRLVSERDLNGYQLSYSYDTNGRLAQITDAAGRALTFTHDTAGRITQVSDPANRTVTYTYDISGDLTSVTDVAGGTTTFVYDAAHRMTSMTDPRGGVVSNVYDPSSRVTQQTDRDGGVTTFQYSDTVTTIIDPNGNVKRQEYLDGVLTAATKGVGTTAEATWRYTYDPATLGTETVTDPNGNVTSYTYDQYGNTLTAVDPLDRGTTFAYGPHNELTSVTDPAGATASLVYDANANLLSISRPLTGTADTQTTTFTYGDTAHPGDVTATTDPTNRTWQLAHDADGNLTVVTDPAGAATTHSYNGIGWRTATVSPRGNATGADPLAYTISYTHNAFGQVTTATDPTGGVTNYTYDANGNVVSLTDPDGNVTGYTYDAADRPTLVTRPDGTTLGSAYDAKGNLTTQTDAAGNVTTYTYDPLDRVASMTDPLARTTSFGYDPAGNQTSITDPAGQTTTLSYDAADQLTGVNYSDGSTPSVNYDYDAKGRRTSMTDGTGTSIYSWDSLNRLVSMTDGANQAVGYGYDLAGRVTEMIYPNAGTVTRGYDSAGRLSSVTDWLANTTTFSYDLDGNLIGEARPNSTTAAYTIDPAGRLMGIDHTGPQGLIAQFDYTRTPSGLLSSAATTGITQPNETYGYTPLDQLASVNTDTYDYDPADNITKLLDGSTLAYDAASQLTSLTDPGGAVTSYGYDSRGNRTSGVGLDGAPASYVYDQANRLVTAGATDYAYNGDGLRSAKTTTTGTQVALTVVLVVGDSSLLSAADVAIKRRLEAAHGAMVVVRDDNAPEDYSNADLVVVTDSALSTTVQGKYGPAAPVPVLVLEEALWDDHEMSEQGGRSTYAGPAVRTAPQPSPLSAGLSNPAVITNGLQTMGSVDWDRLPDQIGTTGLRATTDAQRVVGFSYEAGAWLTNGDPAPARRVGLGFYDDVIVDLNASGWQVIDNAVLWLNTGTVSPNVLMVVGDDGAPTSGDVALRDRIVATLGATVTMIDDQAAEDLSGIDLVVVAETSLSANVATKYGDDAAVPVLNFEPALWDDHELTTATGNGISEGLSHDSVYTTLDQHPLTASYPDTADLFNQPVDVGTVEFNDMDDEHRTAAAWLPGPNGRALLFTIDTGDRLDNGVTAPARRAGLGLTEEAAFELTELGWELFDDTVAWAAGTPAPIPVTAPTVTLVVGDSASLTAADAAIKSRMETVHNATVNVRDDDAVEDYGGAHLVILADSVDPMKLVFKYGHSAPVPVLVLQEDLWSSHQLSGSSTSSTQLAETVQVAPNANPLTTGLADPAVITNSPARTGVVHWSLLPNQIGTTGLRATSDDEQVIGFSYDAGTRLANGVPAPARRVALGFYDDVIIDLTATGWDVIDNAVTWLNDSTPTPHVQLVVGDNTALTAGDIALRDRIAAALGATIDIVDDQAAENLTGTDLAVISETALSANVASKYGHTATVPVLNLEAALWDDHHLSSTTGSHIASALTHNDVYTTLDRHPITANHANPLALFNNPVSAGSVPFDDMNHEHQSAAAWLPGVNGQALLFTRDAGEPLDNGTAAPARRSALGFTEQAVAELTAEGWQLFDDTVTWTETSVMPAAGQSDTTEFTWDHASGLPLLLTASNADGDTHLIYGPGGMPLAQIAPDSSIGWYHHDQLGSTRVVTDNSGNPLGTYTYDPYGATTGSTGSYEPLLDYAGQYTDDETGFQYLRARYYDPTTRQFLTRDPLASITHDPYGYAGDNPLNFVDPNGLNKCEVGANPLRWAGNAQDCVSDAARSDLAQTIKGGANTASMVTSGVAAVSSLVLAVAPITAPVTVPVAFVSEGVAAGSGLVATVIECADGGSGFDCATGVAATAIPFVSFPLLNQIRLGAGEDIARWANSLLSSLGFLSEGIAFSRDALLGC